MPVSLEYKNYIMDLLSPMEGMTSRSMFGAVGLFIDGKMFGIISRNDRFYFKIDNKNLNDFEDAGSGPFKPHADRSMTMSYYEVPVDLLEDHEELLLWAQKAWEAACRVAEKKLKRKKRV